MPVKCKVCEKEFVPNKYKPKQKFCSQHCNSIWQNKNGILAQGRKKAALERVKICHYCKKSFNAYSSVNCYCSNSCLDKWAWKHGNKGKNRRLKFVAQRIERDKKIGSCALCNIRWDQIIRSFELGCIVANPFRGTFHRDHIIPRSHGGIDDPSNIRYLCWFCNSTRKDMDSKFDIAIVEAGKAFWKSLIPLMS